jgi:uncharacterized protein (TIGR02147 family)
VKYGTCSKYLHTPVIDFNSNIDYYLGYMKSTLPNVFEYNDFRKYLEDYQQSRYSLDSTFTRSSVCKSLGLPNTRSFLKSIINGQKVTKTFVDRFINLLELNKEEAKYFSVLVKFNQAEDAGERELYFDQLIALNQTPKMIMTKNSYQYYKNWYNSAIRAVLSIYDFNGSYKKLAKIVFPAITEKNAKDAVTLLLKLKLIEKNRDGFYKPNAKSITTAPYVHDEIIKQYQLQCLELAKNALIKNHSLPQDISTNVLYISKEGYNRIREKLNTFRSEIRAIVHKDENPADRVYQLDILFFPNSKQEGKITV